MSADYRAALETELESVANKPDRVTAIKAELARLDAPPVADVRPPVESATIEVPDNAAIDKPKGRRKPAS